ncbi:hypothetical protein [Lentibacillus sp. JNUCC-1]|nr:hypothetical protein [Lentibacillus sp. JNUCC-1]
MNEHVEGSEYMVLTSPEKGFPAEKTLLMSHGTLDLSAVNPAGDQTVILV